MRIPDKDKHRNPDGTYNGISYMAELSGLSQEEIKWTAARCKELYAAGHTRDEVRTIVKREASERFGRYPFQQK